jgi:hypothetical protein
MRAATKARMTRERMVSIKNDQYWRLVLENVMLIPRQGE